MEIFYTKKFSKDIDSLSHDTKIKKRLLQIIEKLQQADFLTEINDVRKIQGYEEYYRLRVGDYRLGIKVTKDGIEMLRCLHRKDIYKKFP